MSHSAHVVMPQRIPLATFITASLSRRDWRVCMLVADRIGAMP